jgi:hypothetical protein
MMCLVKTEVDRHNQKLYITKLLAYVPAEKPYLVLTYLILLPLQAKQAPVVKLYL